LADTIYDYVIVGAGSSGCVLADKLSEDPAKHVLLVESGPEDRSPYLRMPRGIGKILNVGNPHTWDYEVSPGGNKPPEVWLKGKAIGGSSSINGMVYMRGEPHEYDAWAAAGCTGWGWDAIGRCFVALEDHALGADEWRGTGGPLHVTVHPAGNPLCEAVLAGAGEIGVPRVADINDVAVSRTGGMGYQTRNTWKNQRFSAATAFLAPARKRRNLTVLAETDVLKVEIEDRRVTGVTLRGKDGKRRFAAAREVILSAGAIQSPKILQLSGIGPGTVLGAAGVPVVFDAPGVGANLREHRYLQTVYRVKGASMNGNFAGAGLAKSVLQYGLFRKGALTHAAHEVGGLVKTRPDLDYCDAQIGVSLYSLGYGPKGIVPDPYPGLTILGYFGTPESEGVLRITSADPAAKPYIDANHFAAEIDRSRAISLFRWLQTLGRTAAMRAWIISEKSPGADIRTDEDILQNAVSLGGTSFHIAGTCRMGADELSVVDPQLRVRGVRGLRVCDTSIMPTLVTGNTNAPAMAIALRAAELIKEAR
jgi:choline dehydrogenase-like flavoprotein